jgi:hypothetical protein
MVRNARSAAEPGAPGTTDLKARIGQTLDELRVVLPGRKRCWAFSSWRSSSDRSERYLTGSSTRT